MMAAEAWSKGSWMDSAEEDSLSILWPGGRVPVSVLLDDPTPCRNPMWYEFPDAGHVAEIPNAFTERFADVIKRTGARGKFSVIPCPGGQGRLDEGVPGLADEELRAFLRIVGERIAPTWDVGPEMMTHNRAYDVETGRLLPEREDVWAAHQTVETLTPYISLALQILCNVDLQPNGVTSPWAFGSEVEDAYTRATVTALREVCGVRVGWYFVHVDKVSSAVPPRIGRLHADQETALVSLVSASRDAAGHADFAWRTQYGEPARTDALLSRDGTSGRLAELFPQGEPMIFHTHWQSMFSNGSGAGLDALEDLFGRINRTWGDRVIWMSARELALYTAARAATRVRTDDEGRGVVFDAPFRCANFTVILPATGAVSLNGLPLTRIDGDEGLREGTWRLTANGAVACFALRDGDELRWE
jgi:hypothetical protein